MFKIEAIIQPSKLDDVTVSLRDLDVGGVSICEVLSHGGPYSQKLHYRGAEYSADSPMIELRIIVSSLRVDEVVDAIRRAARTRFDWDDGTILVYEVADAIRIRTGERAEFSHS